MSNVKCEMVKACLTFHLSRFTKMNRHNLLDLALGYFNPRVHHAVQYI